MLTVACTLPVDEDIVDSTFLVVVVDEDDRDTFANDDTFVLVDNVDDICIPWGRNSNGFMAARRFGIHHVYEHD